MALQYHQPETVPATLLQRLEWAGIGTERATKLIADGLVRVDGSEEPTTDPEASCPRPTSWHIAASS